MEKKTYATVTYYYKTQIMGAYTTEVHNLARIIEDFKYSDTGDKYVVEFIDMTKDEFDNLPEFAGF